MPQYQRYLLSSLIGPTLIVTFCLTSVVWLTQSLRFIDLIVNRGLTIGMFMYLTALLLPSLLLLILPVALFSAIIYTYNKLYTDSELIVFESVGLSRFDIARPALMLGVLVVLFLYSISLYFLPSTFRQFKDLQHFIRNNYASALLQEEVFNTPVDWLTVYIKERDDSGLLRGILVHDSRLPDKPVTMMAQSGQLMQTPSGPRLVLTEGNRQEVDKKKGQLSLLHFDSYNVDISQLTKEEDTRWREPKERYLHELLAPDPENPHYQDRLYAEAHERLTWPLYGLALPCLALAILLSGDFNRRGQWRRILSASLAAVPVVAVGVSLKNVISKNIVLAPLSYIFVAVVITGALYVLLRAGWHRGRHPASAAEAT